MADRKASGLIVCPACQFTEAVRLETSILTKFALWQCLDCRLVFIQPHNESQDYVDRAERRRICHCVLSIQPGCSPNFLNGPLPSNAGTC
jgi:hypothetical protein